MFYKICPDCGAYLNPGEVCCCQAEDNEMYCEDDMAILYDEYDGLRCEI